MLDAVRRWLTGGNGLPGWGELAAWSRAGRWTLRPTTQQDGWVMDGGAAHPGWRLEWGPAQRSFMGSHELRVRVDLPQLPDVQALVLDRPLLERLDRAVFQQFTGSVQTRFDDETPEEMRWLAMLEKLSPNAMGESLRDRYGAIGDDPALVARWLQGPLAEALRRHAVQVPAAAVASEPFILRLARGRLVIRQAAPRPRAALLQACVDVAAATQQVIAGAR